MYMLQSNPKQPISRIG